MAINSELIAEESTVGGLMIDASKWFEVKQIVSIEDFHSGRVKAVFKAISKQLNNGQPADVVTLCDTKGLDLGYVASLAKNTPSAANTSAYAKEVKKYSDRRKFLSLTQEINTSVSTGTKTPGQAIDQLIERYQEGSFSRNDESFVFKQLSEMKLKPVDWLIKDFMESDSLIELFGAPESGKSLLAIDWALCVASGVTWQECKVHSGSVFYIAGEGHNGLYRRFKAWAIANDVDLDTLPFYASERAASFCNKESAKEVELSIASIIEKTGESPRFVVIDTLARNFGGGNENSTEDMGQFVSHIDEHIRVRFKTTVLLVHHTGHGATDRGRGSSSLKAAVDTEYRMNKDGGVANLDCTKMKDAPHPKPRAFNIKVIDLLIVDEDGQTVNGVVLEETEYREPSKPDTKGIGKNQRILLETLQFLTERHREEFINRGKNPDNVKVSVNLWSDSSDIPKQRFNEAKKSLEEKGVVKIEPGGFAVLNETGNES